MANLKISTLDVENLFAPNRDDLLDFDFTGVTSNSKAVKEGSLFVAVSGSNRDGHEFIRDAFSNGAKLAIGEKTADELDLGTLPYISVRDSKLAYGRLCAAFFRNPTQDLTVVGVTGTSGKTTTTHLIESVFKAASLKVGIIGTIEYRSGSKTYPASHTTPDAYDLNEILREMKDDGCKAVIMEVSSHALKQERVSGILFDAMVFTNLTPEHLDYHPTMEDYFHSKLKLFTDCNEFSKLFGKDPCLVVNSEDEYGQKIVAHIGKDRIDCFSRSDFSLESSLDGVSGEVASLKFSSKLIGDFNASNISAAIRTGLSLGFSAQQIVSGLQTIDLVPGRLEPIGNERGVGFFVDYAHKPDALEKVLKVLHKLRGNPENRIITVFGCGGDRDRTKRPVMGRIAEDLSNLVIVTSDNPRTEDPTAIIKDILRGMKKPPELILENREEAIKTAVQLAREGDLVLVAGKGHEDYQIVGTEKRHFDDREIIRNALKSK